MNTSEIERLHDRAVSLYVEGRYPEACQAWEQILSVAPDDGRAAEGIRMVKVLSGEWRGPADGSGSSGNEAPRIEMMLRAGCYGEAAAASRALLKANPGSEHVRSLARRAQEMFEAEPFITAELARARAAHERHDDGVLIEACRRILVLDPGHAEALELMEIAPSEARTERPRAERMGAGSEPRVEEKPRVEPFEAAASGGTGASSAAGAASLSAWFAGTEEEFSEAEGLTEVAGPTRTEPETEDPQETAPASVPASEVAEDSFFDLLKEDVAAEPPTKTAGAVSPPPAPVSSGPDPTSGLKEAPGSAHGSLFEMPDGDVETIGTAASGFSGIEAEIDESQGVVADGEVDFDLPPAGSPPPSAPATEAAAGLPGDSDHELAFDAGFTSSGQGEGESAAEEEPFWEDAKAEAPESVASETPESRIASLLREARRFLDQGRYSDTIEAAARVFAIDPEAAGAQELIDDARAKQEQADRVAEETIVQARDLIAVGDIEGAEREYREVLKTHPGHREVLGALEEIARKRESEFRRGTGSGVREEISVGASAPAVAPLDGQRADEPLTPPRLAEITPQPQVPRAAPAVAVPAAGRRRLRLSPRVIVFTGIALAMVLVSLVGVRFVGKMLSVGGPPASSTQVVPRSDRKQVIKVEKPAAAKAVPPPAAAPDPAAGIPRTLPEARKLGASGKLDAARAVLIDIVKREPENVAALNLLKSVHARIVERDQIAGALEDIKSAYKQERYEDALRLLYRVPQSMQKGDIEQYKANAWYNNGLLYLSGGNCTEAVRCFDEALQINGRDDGARRLKAFARGYLGKEKDGAYLATVQNLPKRPIDG